MHGFATSLSNGIVSVLSKRLPSATGGSIVVVTVTIVLAVGLGIGGG